MKKNSWNNSSTRAYFWRNYNQSEVDYIEDDNGTLSAYEVKYNTQKNNRISKAFTNMYLEANTEIITPDNFYDFLF